MASAVQLDHEGPDRGFNIHTAANTSKLWASDVMERPAWQADAACRGQGVSVFFGARGEPSKWEEAKRVCAECPVRIACLDYGLHEKHGIWGGLSERERRRVRRKRAGW